MLKNLEIANTNLEGRNLTDIMALVRIPPSGPIDDFIDRMIARSDQSLSEAAELRDREPVGSIAE